MKKIIFSALTLLTLFSCSKDDKQGGLGDGESRIVFNAKTSYEVENISTRAPHTYLIKLEGAENREFTLESTTVAATPGDYTITATTPVSYTMPAFDTPVYQDVTNVTVPVDGAVAASLTCVQINAGVRLVFDQSVRDFYTEVTAKIEDNADAGKTLSFGYADEGQRIAYFDPADLKISLTSGGSPVHIGAQESAVISTKKKQLWTITLKTSQTLPGTIDIQITVDESTDPKDNELGIGDVAGLGTFESPFNVASAINTMPVQNVWIQGYIVGQSTITPVTRTTSNGLLIGNKADAKESECIVMGLDAAPAMITNLLTEASAVGKTVKLKGDLAGRAADFTSDARGVIFNITDFDYEGQEKGIDGTNPITLSDLTLKEINKESIFRMGATVKTDPIYGGDNPAPQNYHDLLARDFNSVTLEYEMKMSLQVKLNAGEDVYRTERLNKFGTEYIKNNNLDVHGHVLVWYKDVPESWESLTDAVVKTNLEEYIRTTMLKYPYVRSWDVVNEAFTYNGTGYEECLWKDVYGGAEEYVKTAFQIARRVVKEEGLTCKLFYNDYGNERYPAKADKITAMIKKLNEEHAAANAGEVLIDGIGLQMHLYLNTIDQCDLEYAIDKAIETGGLVHISELSLALFQNEEDQVTVTDELLAKQTQVFNQVFDLAFNKVGKDKLWGITFWGLNDTYSLYTQRQGMLFDKDYNAKRSYFEIINKYSN